jgi:predicted DNA-binding transcriptional regulator AlpA
MNALRNTLIEIRSKAAELRDSFGDEPRARALEWAASQMERAIREDGDERLTLAEAALRSGYSRDHIARLIRDGRLPNAGRSGSPRIRAGDLPVRPPRPVAGNRPRAYDPIADARAIGSRR